MTVVIRAVLPTASCACLLSCLADLHRSPPGPRVRNSLARKGNEDAHQKYRQRTPHRCPSTINIKTNGLDHLGCSRHACEPPALPVHGRPRSSCQRPGRVKLQCSQHFAVPPAEPEEEQGERVECRRRGRREKQELQLCTLERPNRPGKRCTGREGSESKGRIAFPF